MVRNEETGTKTELRIASPELVEPKGNPTTEYFFNLSSQVVGLKSKQELAAIGLTEEKLNKLKEALKLFGLRQQDGESLSDFFHRVSAFFYYQFPQIGKTLTQGVVPTNLDQMVQDLEKRKAIIAEIKEKGQIDKLLERYQLNKNEVNQAINRLIEIRTEKVKTALAAEGVTTTPIAEIEKIAVTSLQKKPNIEVSLADTAVPVSVKKKLKTRIANFVSSNRYTAATVAVTSQLASPPPEIEEQLPKEIRTLPKEIRARIAGKIAPALVSHAHQMADSPETVIRTVTPLVAIALDDEGIKLPNESGHLLVLKLISPATPIAKTIAQDFTPSELIEQGKKAIEPIITSHFIRLGLDPTGKTVGPVITIISQNLATTPSYLARSLTVVNLTKELTISETSSSLPENPINFFHSIIPDQRTNPIAYLYSQATISQAHPFGLNNKITEWSSFAKGHGKSIGSDPMLFYYDHLYRSDEQGIAYQVSQQPLYILKSLGRPVIKPLVDLGKKKVFQKIARSGLGKAVKKGVEKVAMTVAKKLALETGKEVAIKGGAGAIAAALGIPTGGVSLLIWATIEVVTKVVRVVFSKLKKLFKQVSRALDVITLGLTSDIRNWIRNNLGNLPAKLFDFAKVPAAFLASLIAAPLAIAIGPMLIFVFIITFASLFFFNYHSNRYTAALRPPLGGQDFGMGITEEGLSADIGPIMPFEADITYCKNIGQPASKLACVLMVVISDNNCPTINGAITNKNSRDLEACLLASENLKQIISDDKIRQIATRLAFSANTYEFLQCVGFKAAVEPNLPGLGDAYNFTNIAKISRYCNVISNPNSLNIAGIRIGDNAAWGPGKNCGGETCAKNIACCGHIGIVVGFPKDDPNGIIIAQAWGDTGIINFRKYPIASATYIRCH